LKKQFEKKRESWDKGILKPSIFHMQMFDYGAVYGDMIGDIVFAYFSYVFRVNVQNAKLPKSQKRI